MKSFKQVLKEIETFEYEQMLMEESENEKKNHSFWSLKPTTSRAPPCPPSRTAPHGLGSADGRARVFGESTILNLRTSQGDRGEEKFEWVSPDTGPLLPPQARPRADGARRAGQGD